MSRKFSESLAKVVLDTRLAGIEASISDAGFETVATNNLLVAESVEFNVPYSTANGSNVGGATNQYWILLPAKPAYFYACTLATSAFIFYDAAMTFISAASSVRSFKAPANTAFVRIRLGVNSNQAAVATASVAESSNIPGAYIAPEVQQLTETSRFGFSRSKWYKKTWFVMGDSISTGDGLSGLYATQPYHWVIAKENQARVHSLATSGRTIAIASNADNLNQQVTNGKMPATADAPDLVTVFAGTNDFGFNIPMGTIADTGPASFYGGLNKLFTDLQARFPAARIGVITPIPRADKLVNVIPLTLADYVTAIKLTAKKYEIPVLDLYNDGCGVNFNNNDVTTLYTVNNDKVHPNNAGHLILAPKISAFIETL